MKDIGLEWKKVYRYIDEIIYTLPGVENHKDKLSVVLTGSRASGTYSDTSDVDLDVICSRETFNLIQKAMFESGRTPNINLAFYHMPEEGYEKYYGMV